MGEQKSAEYKVFKPKKKKAKKKRNGLTQDSALGWDDFRTDAGGRILIISNVFAPEDSKEEGFAEDLEVDIEAECTKKAGVVEKVTVFKDHPDGVVAVKFKENASAEKMLVVMNGRWFSQRKLS